MELNKKLNNKNKILPLILFILSMLSIDFVQYDFNITSHIYTLVWLGLLSFAFMCGRIDKAYVWIFILILLFQDLSRFFYIDHNFNSLFLGSFKYMFIISITLTGIGKRAYTNKDFLMYSLFFIGIFFISIIKGQANYYIAKDIVFYFNLFFLPILISYALPMDSCKKIIKLYEIFVYSFPIFSLLLLIFNRYYNIFGSLYTTVGNITIMNLAYLVGALFKKNKEKDILKKIYIFAYLGLYFFSPTSGGILLVVAIGLYYVFKKTENVSWHIKGIVLIILVMTLVLLIVTIFNYIIDSPKYSGTFTRFKVIQIQQMFQARSLSELPFSVRVRVAEVLNILHSDGIVEFVFGRGFGGYFEDSLNIFGVISPSDNAFSVEELMSGQYYSAHFILIYIFLKFGLIGSIFYIGNIIKTFNNIKIYYTEFIPVAMVVFYSCGYGIKLLIIFSFIYGSIIKINKHNKKISQGTE